MRPPSSIGLLFAVLAALPTTGRAQSPHLRSALGAPPRATLTVGATADATAGASARSLPVHAQGVEHLADGSARFTTPTSRIDIGPDQGLGLGSDQSFTVRLRLRTTSGAFCTPLMCRESDAVNYSFVVGRQPGTVSFEMWTWGTDRAISSSRIDDGEWHDVVGVYDAVTRSMGILIDGEVQAVLQVSGRDYRPSPRPLLRLGDNIGAQQPFAGSLAQVQIDRGVPATFAAMIAARRQAMVLEPGQADAALEAWLVRMRAPRPPVAADRKAWEATAAATRRQLQDALGLLPPPYPPAGFTLGDGATDFATYRPTLALDVRRGGTLARADYSVTRIYWQTVRGYYASGYLYEPPATTPGPGDKPPATTPGPGDEPTATTPGPGDKPTATAPAPGDKLPAVLCPHGHFRDGARHPVIQSRCITLARHGYVVLAIDSVHLTDDPIQLSPLSLMTLNNLRGLELLRGLPRVDAARIGCTGASGGGQQTFYLTGLRTGLAAVVPAVMVCYFEEILQSSGVHCRCNFTPGVMGFADEPLLAACFAPKPQLFLSVTGDWTKNFPTRGFPEVRAIYAHFDAADQVQSRQWESQHDYNRSMRNAMYAFFGRHLKAQSAPPAELEPADLRTEPRNALLALDRRDVPHDLDAVRSEWRARLSAPRATDPGTKTEGLRPGLFARFGGVVCRGGTLRRIREFTWHEHPAAALALDTDAGVPLPLILLRPGTEPARHLTLLFCAAGKATALHQQRASILALLQRRHAVAVVDVRYCGELDRAHSWREPYGKIFGRDPGVVAAADIGNAVRALTLHLSMPIDRIAVIATGTLGAPALYAAALHGGCSRLVLTDLGPTYRRVDRRPKIAGILRYGDLPIAVGLLPGTTTLLAGGCPDRDAYQTTSSHTIRAAALGWDEVVDALR